MSIHAELFEQSVRGFFFEHNLPADTADQWTDAIVAIAADHPPNACPCQDRCSTPSAGEAR